MNKKILIPIVLCATTMFAQEKNPELQKQQQEIITLKEKINDQQTLINFQKSKLDQFSEETIQNQKEIDSLKVSISNNAENIQSIATELGTKIQQAETTTKDSISRLDQDVETNRLYWIIGTLVLFILGSILYWLLGKRISTSKIDVETQIKNTKKSLEEESIKLDNKLVEVLESQLKLKQEEKQVVEVKKDNEVDHSLVLKVADEIIRIQKNINQMDPGTKGLKQLSRAVKSIQDNFASKDYELVEMLGKEYNEGMKVIANFIPSEDIETGKQIITRIIKPQVNYKGQMIQSAQIEVSVGE